MKIKQAWIKYIFKHQNLDLLILFIPDYFDLEAPSIRHKFELLMFLLRLIIRLKYWHLLLDHKIQRE